MYKITQYMYKREQTLSYARALRSIHLFSSLLKGDQFHVYLTAQAQNAVPRIFDVLTYQAYQNSNALFNLRLLLVLAKVSKQAAHQAGAYPSFCSMKPLVIFLLPLDGMLVHRRVTPSIKFAGTHLYI